MITPGWGFSPVSTRWHYFDSDGMSLCKKVGFFQGETEQGNDDSPENCAKCKRLLEKHQSANNGL